MSRQGSFETPDGQTTQALAAFCECLRSLLGDSAMAERQARSEHFVFSFVSLPSGRATSLAEQLYVEQAGCATESDIVDLRYGFPAPGLTPMPRQWAERVHTQYGLTRVGTLQRLHTAGFPHYQTIIDLLFYKHLISAVPHNFPTRGARECEDLVHQFFVDCAEAWRHRYDPTLASLATFVHRSARPRSLRAGSARAVGVWRRDEPRDVVTGLEVIDLATPLDDEDVAESVARRVDAQRLRRSADDWDEVVRLYLEGASYVEISRRTGVKPGAARMRVQRFIDRMRQGGTG